MRNDKNSNPEQNPDLDLDGFDKLWSAEFEETADFIRSKKSKADTEVLVFLESELETKNFELQKLQWQLGEREKELRNLYLESSKMLELNKKLNKQLEDYQELESKYLEIIRQIAGQNDFEPRSKAVLKIIK